MKNKSFVQWLDEGDGWFWQYLIVILTLSLVSFFDFHEWKVFFDIWNPGHEHTLLWPQGAKEWLDSFICGCIIPSTFRDAAVLPQNDGIARLIEWSVGLATAIVLPFYAAARWAYGSTGGGPRYCKQGAFIAVVSIFAPYITTCLFGRAVYWGAMIIAALVVFGKIVVTDTFNKITKKSK